MRWSEEADLVEKSLGRGRSTSRRTQTIAPKNRVLCVVYVERNIYGVGDGVEVATGSWISRERTNTSSELERPTQSATASAFIARSNALRKREHISTRKRPRLFATRSAFGSGNSSAIRASSTTWSASSATPRARRRTASGRERDRSSSAVRSRARPRNVVVLRRERTDARRDARDPGCVARGRSGQERSPDRRDGLRSQARRHADRSGRRNAADQGLTLRCEARYRDARSRLPEEARKAARQAHRR